MDGASPRPAEELYREVLALAKEQLGPASAQYVDDQAAFLQILASIREGAEPLDALLREVHASAREDRWLEDEFLRHLMPEFTRAASRAMRERMRRLYDTDDLANSVMTSLWPRLYEIEFRTRGEFLSYFYKRLGWKASDRDRSANAGSRREDLRVPLQPEDVGHDENALLPEEMAARRERLRHAKQTLERLQPPERAAVEAWARDASWTEIAADLSTDGETVKPDTARKRVARALQRLREMHADGESPAA